MGSRGSDPDLASSGKDKISAVHAITHTPLPLTLVPNIRLGRHLDATGSKRKGGRRRMQKQKKRQERETKKMVNTHGSQLCSPQEAARKYS